MKQNDARHTALDREQLTEQKRLSAVKSVESGQSVNKVAATLGVHRSQVYRWINRFKAGGESGLKTRRATGRHPALSQNDEQQLQQLLLKRPKHYGLPYALWTQAAVKDLIKQQFALDLNKNALHRVLSRLGLNCQRPQTHLSQNKSAKLQRWFTDNLTQLQTQVRQQKAFLCYCELITTNTTSRDKTFYIVASTPQARLYFVQFNKLDVQVFIDFIKQLLKQIEHSHKKLILVADASIQQHIPKDSIRDQLASRDDASSEKLEITFLPGSLSNTESKNKATEKPTTTQKSDTKKTDIKNPVDALIQSMHFSVLETPAWVSFLQKLSEALNCSHTSIMEDIFSSDSRIFAHQPKASEIEDTLKLEQEYRETWHTNPYLPLVKEKGDIVSTSQVEALVKQKKYTLHPRIARIVNFAESPWGLCLCFARQGKELSCLLLARPRHLKDFTQSEKQMLRALQPHLEIAMRTCQRLKKTSLSLQALEDATSYLRIGTLVLDGKNRVVETNPVARHLLNQSKYCQLLDQKLRFPQKADNQQFEEIIAKMTAWRRGQLTEGEIKAEYPAEVMQIDYSASSDGAKDKLGVLVRPIVETHVQDYRTRMVETSPHLIVYISNLTHLMPPPKPQQVAKLLGLRPREAHLATLLTSGHDIADAATVMHISITSARTYLQRIYEKLEINRQSELIQIVLNSVAPLA